METSAPSAKSVPSHQVLSPRERERLRNEERSLQAQLQGRIVVSKNKRINETGLSDRKKGYFEQFLRDDVKEDKTLIKRRLDRVRHVLTQGTPQPLNRAERAKAEKQMEADREWLKKNMTPRELYYAKYNSPEFDKAKQAASRELKPTFQKVANRYVQTVRTLDPENEERNLLEKLRP